MLGYYLVGWGYCSEEDLRYMVEMQDHFGVMLGELVVKMNHMSKDELDAKLIASFIFLGLNFALFPWEMIEDINY